ncbi:PEGA domain-containing protein [Acidobacteria bacterium AH-259-A15]|nr:PEGA domain-containing protein [Acidobacteria bacterium AH-259-A15]
MRRLFLCFFAVLILSSSLQGGHFSSPIRRGHFFLPSRTLFFFRPDLYIYGHAFSGPIIYSSPVYQTVSFLHGQRSYGVYQIVLNSPVRTEIVRANTADLIIKANPPKALVYVDDKLIGSARDFATERDRYTLLEGAHHLRIEFPGYKSFQTEMEVVANRTLHLDIELPRLAEKSDER